MEEIKAIEPAEEKMRSCHLKEEADLSRNIATESDSIQPKDCRLGKGLSRSPIQACLRKHVASEFKKSEDWPGRPWNDSCWTGGPLLLLQTLGPVQKGGGDCWCLH